MGPKARAKTVARRQANRVTLYVRYLDGREVEQRGSLRQVRPTVLMFNASAQVRLEEPETPQPE